MQPSGQSNASLRHLARISHKATVFRAAIATIRSRIRHLPGTCVQAPKDRVFLWRAPGLRPLVLVRCCVGLQVTPRETRHAYGGEKSRLGDQTVVQLARPLATQK